MSIITRALALLCACALATLLIPAGAERVLDQAESPATPGDLGGYVAGELLAVVGSEEEAREIADLYGITLTDVSYGLAKFTTDRDPQEVIAEGKANGWPELSLNQTYHLD